MAIHESDQSYSDPEKEAASWARDREEKWWSLSSCERDRIRAEDRAFYRRSSYCGHYNNEAPYRAPEPEVPSRSHPWSDSGDRHLNEVKQKAYCLTYLRNSNCGVEGIENNGGLGLRFGDQNGPKHYYTILRQLVENDKFFDWFCDDRNQIILRAGNHSEADWKQAKERFVFKAKSLLANTQYGSRPYDEVNKKLALWLKEVDPERDVVERKFKEAKVALFEAEMASFKKSYKEYKAGGLVCFKVSEECDNTVAYSIFRPDTNTWYCWERAYRKDKKYGGLIRPAWNSEIDESFFL